VNVPTALVIIGFLLVGVFFAIIWGNKLKE